MAGGKGERFWPRSRTNSPKQLRKVYSNKTLLKETIDRALTITDLDRIFIGTNASLKKAILEQEKSFPEKNFIIEPEGKNTAPIIALASLHFQAMFGDPIQVVLSADAFIDPVKEFTKTMKLAIQEAEEHLVLLGIKPSRPETGYGYISTGKFLPKGKSLQVKEFVEKPNVKKATGYIKKSNMYWNPGIFIWKTSLILEEFRAYANDILAPLENGFPFKTLGGLGQSFRVIPSQPVDIAIMERSKRICMVPATFQWDDVGSWLSLERILPQKSGNQHQGKEVIYHNSSGVISSVSKDLVAFLGVEDLVVVEEEDVLFISSKKGLDGIKDMLGQMKKNRSLQKYLE
ncbi:MAG: mannose-1-phosphate guanylyltransferase [Leptospira sp.]|nr:mannose-1-phosphate guanylyltransferase [Leptospira sp.]